MAGPELEHTYGRGSLCSGDGSGHVPVGQEGGHDARAACSRPAQFIHGLVDRFAVQSGIEAFDFDYFGYPQAHD